MAERIVQLVILAEDLRAATLFRRYAEHFVEKRRIRTEICPQGSGEQFVRAEFPRKVKWLRSCAGKKSAALIVHIDADHGSVANRLQQLADALRHAMQDRRGNDERIAIAVPKRNVETWIHGLCGMEVDENYDFKRDPDGKVAPARDSREKLADSRLKPAAKALYDLTRPNAAPPPPSVPALQAAIPELRCLET